jgi:outer membrane immunogenic protein
MKKLFLASAALVAIAAGSPTFAADLPARMPAYKAPIAAPVAFSWTGCYLGAHIGGGFGEKRWSSGGVEFANHNTDGFIGGGQLGCNYQTGQFVFGVEGDASWADLTGSSIDTLNPTVTTRSKVDFLATATGRAGIAYDRALFYVKGGAAWAHDKFSTDSLGGTFSADQTRWGWTVGAGIEYAFAPNWSAKVENNFMDFDKKTVNGIFAIPVDIDQNIHAVKVGINYKFF